MPLLQNPGETPTKQTHKHNWDLHLTTIVALFEFQPLPENWQEGQMNMNMNTEKTPLGDS